MNVCLVGVMVSGVLLTACASRAATPVENGPAPAVPVAAADSALHVGATVRVRGAGLGRGWRIGMVVVSAGALPCLAVKLLSTRSGGAFYVPLQRFSRVEADQRTNSGALTLGLPPAQATDWAVVDLARAVSRRCRR